MKNKKYLNYVKFIIITIIMIVLTISVCTIYTKVKRSDQSMLAMNLQSINYNELGSYAVENPEFILYMGFSKNKEKETLETDIYDYALDNGFLKQLIYLDLTTMEDEDYGEMRNLYFNINLKDIEFNENMSPYIAKFSDGKIVALLSIDETISINEIRTFLGINSD